ncbi:hypothetical protein BDV96DRAFT_594793 [Lophiotrema nucula]|uniref:Uncharacterized protein n=1 Tax=Lophiotrema nucula TaxID=690887 RepID=A0A6A5ZRX0_9PLEO|nr:hypothetical protein BDV96DRAFT_594793 [Lophiotrema nucula]
MSYDPATLFAPSAGSGHPGAMGSSSVAQTGGPPHFKSPGHKANSSELSSEVDGEGDSTMNMTFNTVQTTPETAARPVKGLSTLAQRPAAMAPMVVFAPASVAPAAPAPAPVLPNQVPGTPFPPHGYSLEIPWSKVWSAQTLKSKSNQTKMKHFLRINQLPSTQYSSLKGDALTALVRHRQGLNEHAYNITKKAADAAAAAEKEKKRALHPHDSETEGDAENAKPQKKKIKTSSLAGRPRNISSNLSLVTAGMIRVKKFARRDVNKWIALHGYEWDLGDDSEDDDDDSGADDIESVESDQEFGDDAFETKDRFAEQTVVFDKDSRKPVLSAEAQYRIREAILTKYGIRTLRRDSHMYSAGQLKIARKAMRSARKNFRKLVHAVTTSIRGTEHKNKARLAEDLIRTVLGEDIDGQVDEHGNPLKIEEVSVKAEAAQDGGDDDGEPQAEDDDSEATGGDGEEGAVDEDDELSSEGSEMRAYTIEAGCVAHLYGVMAMILSDKET